MVSPVVVTGFEPFGEHRDNVSASIVRALERQRNEAWHCEVLPTSFARAGARIERLIETGPRAVLLLGLNAKARAVRLERLAHNRDRAALRDNDGEERLDVPIVAGAPEHYASTLPLERFADRVQALGFPVELSDHAGGFVCNHTFYRALHQMARGNLGIQCGFVHLPPSSTPSGEPWLGAIEACLGLIQTSIR